MNNENILKVKAESFDFASFLLEIRRNLSSEIDEFSMPIYLNKKSETEYLSIQGTEHMHLTPEFIEEDIKSMDRTIYVTFIHSSGTKGYGIGSCGDGKEINMNNMYLGDFFHDDCGFLIEAKDGYLEFKKAHYNLAYRGEGTVYIVKNVGDLEFELEEFLNSYMHLR